MSGFPLLNMKRRGFDNAHEESELLFSSPARKIRRLDAEVPLILEGVGQGFHSRFEPEIDVNHHWLSQGMVFPSAFEVRGGDHLQHEGSLESDMCIITQANEERALVLYKSVDPISPASPNISLNVSPSFISDYCGQSMFWQRNLNPIISAADDPTMLENSASDNNHLALVPWVPNGASEVPRIKSMEEKEEEEEEEAAAMEIEDETCYVSGNAPRHWQQHCVTTWPSTSLLSPIVWST